MVLVLIFVILDSLEAKFPSFVSVGFQDVFIKPFLGFPHLGIIMEDAQA